MIVSIVVCRRRCGRAGEFDPQKLGRSSLAKKIIEGITYVALATDHLLTVVLGGKGLKRGFDNATTETKDEMESRFLFVDTQVSISIFARIPISQLQKTPVTDARMGKKGFLYLLDVVVTKRPTIL